MEIEAEVTLSKQIFDELVRIAPSDNAIIKLAYAAANYAESLTYLADIDDRRFGQELPDDNYSNVAVNQAHVLWATRGALSSLDICMAAISRLCGIKPVKDKEATIRSFYQKGKRDERNIITLPWRDWIDTTSSRIQDMMICYLFGMPLFMLICTVPTIEQSRKMEQ